MLLLFFSLLAGGLLTLAFAPVGMYTLAFLCPAVLLALWLRSSPARAFWLGWLFGIGFFGTGASWVYVSIYQFGNASLFLASLITFLFILIMGFYFGVFGYVFRKIFSRCTLLTTCLFIFPALWTLTELLRSTLFTGFPWILLGYAQLTTPLSGYAPLIGVYGITLITTMMAGSLILIITHKIMRNSIIALLVIFGFITGGFILQNHAWTKKLNDPIKVSLIQGNISQTTKWDAAYALHNINVYRDLSLSNLSSQLIVWPEGAFPISSHDGSYFIHLLGHIAKRKHSNIIFGVPIVDEKTKQYYNGLLLIGENNGQYLKRHLVPFGEYIPMPSVFGKAMTYFNIPMSNFSRGAQNQPLLIVNHVRIAPFICYEIAFSNHVLREASHSELLVTLSDDSWFGNSIAMAQHLQMSQMRSLETGRYQLLSTNTGITAFISPLGKVMQRAPINKQMVITQNVYPMIGKTPLMVTRYYPLYIVLMLMLLIPLLI